VHPLSGRRSTPGSHIISKIPDFTESDSIIRYGVWIHLGNITDILVHVAIRCRANQNLIFIVGWPVVSGVGGWPLHSEIYLKGLGWRILYNQ